MKRLWSIIISAALITSAHSLGGQTLPDGKSIAGKVDSIYVREHSALYMDARLATCGRKISKPTIVNNWIVYVEMRAAAQMTRCEQLWALVRFPSKGAGVTGGELVKISVDIGLHVGDDVEIAVGENKTLKATGPIHVESRIVRNLKMDERFAQESPVPAVGPFTP